MCNTHNTSMYKCSFCLVVYLLRAQYTAVICVTKDSNTRASMRSLESESHLSFVENLRVLNALERHEDEEVCNMTLYILIDTVTM